jgi:hypothetical protein
LDRHGIVWWGLAGRVGCQRADGAFGHAETWVIDGGICVPAMRQRVALGVRCVCGVNRGRRVPVQGNWVRPGCGWWRLAMPGATGLAWRVWIGLPGAAGGIGCQRGDGAFGDAETWVIDGGICACHATTPLPLGRGAFVVSIESPRCLFGAARTGARSVWCNPVQSCPVRPAHLVGGVW